MVHENKREEEGTENILS